MSLPGRGFPYWLPASILLALIGTWLSPTVGAEPALHGPLDGRVYTGSFGPAGETADTPDTIGFRDGRFWSCHCAPMGFRPGEYWVRYVGEAIHFTGRMESDDSGTFDFTGVVRGEAVEVSLRWRKERWYWSIERDFRFTGTIRESASIALPPEAEGNTFKGNAWTERVCQL